MFGATLPSGAYHGFTEREGNFATVDVPGALLTLVFGNDNRGDLAGAWVDASFVAHGFVALRDD